MTQFAVHANKNPKTKGTYPFLIDVQSNLLRDLSTRVVVPLIKHAAFGKRPIRNLTPIVELEGQKFVMLVPQLAGIAASDLGPAIATVAQQRDEVVAALDFLVTGI